MVEVQVMDSRSASHEEGCPFASVARLFACVRVEFVVSGRGRRWVRSGVQLEPLKPVARLRMRLGAQGLGLPT